MIKNNIIVLTPVYNGKKHIQRFIEKNYDTVDGFVFLDDGSTDGTFDDILTCDKVLAVYNREDNSGFNDLDNRQTILDYMLNDKTFIETHSPEWYVWLDVDEVIYPSFSIGVNLDRKVIEFPLVHLWNDEEHYNTEYPISRNGIQYKYRGFKANPNLWTGLTPVSTVNKNLHFNLIPYKFDVNDIIEVDNAFILHYANVDKEEREFRYKRYKEIDAKGNNLGFGYKHLLKDNPRTKHISTLLNG